MGKGVICFSVQDLKRALSLPDEYGVLAFDITQPFGPNGALVILVESASIPERGDTFLPPRLEDYWRVKRDDAGREWILHQWLAEGAEPLADFVGVTAFLEGIDG